MAKPAKLYAKQMYQNRLYHANWPPGRPRSLGDFGVLEKGYLFTQVGNLARDFNITVTPSPPDTSPDDESSRSKKGVSYSISLDGTVEPVKTKVGFEFAKEGTYVYEAKGVKYSSIQNIQDVGAAILALGSRWNPDWVVVTEVTEAASASILISSTSSGKLEVTANGDVSGEIADPSLGFRVTFERDMFERILAESGLNPTMKLFKIKKKHFGPLSTVTFAEDVQADSGQFVFDEFIPTELLLDEDLD